MSAVLEDYEPGTEGFRRGFRGRERDRILASVHDQRWDLDGPERRAEIEVPEAAPDALLHPADDPERCEVAGTRRIGEVAGDAELERTLAVRLGVALPEARRGELRAKPLNHRALLPSRELGLELLPVAPGDGRRVDQSEGLGSG